MPVLHDTAADGQDRHLAEQLTMHHLRVPPHVTDSSAPDGHPSGRGTNEGVERAVAIKKRCVGCAVGGVATSIVAVDKVTRQQQRVLRRLAIVPPSPPDQMQPARLVEPDRSSLLSRTSRVTRVWSAARASQRVASTSVRASPHPRHDGCTVRLSIMRTLIEHLLAAGKCDERVILIIPDAKHRRRVASDLANVLLLVPQPRRRETQDVERPEMLCTRRCPWQSRQARRRAIEPHRAGAAAAEQDSGAQGA